VISFFSSVFVGLILWGAVDEINTILAFAIGTFVAVALGFVFLNWAAKPDENVEPGKPRLK
jgi:phosphotransferase system  glucose/maltose/N-acetylglucosamine-specific IIC component